jgi:hypothetical protein
MISQVKRNINRTDPLTEAEQANRDSKFRGRKNLKSEITVCATNDRGIIPDQRESLSQRKALRYRQILHSSVREMRINFFSRLVGWP